MSDTKTPSKDLQQRADMFLAGLECETIVDPSCTLACLLQQVRDEAIDDCMLLCVDARPPHDDGPALYKRLRAMKGQR